MKTVLVGIKFSGKVIVSVPDHLSEADAIKLAENLTLSRILATVENKDAPDDYAFDDYLLSCDAFETAENDYDASYANEPNGEWNVSSSLILK